LGEIDFTINSGQDFSMTPLQPLLDRLTLEARRLGFADRDWAARPLALK
jgi:hypothetical protein